MFFRDLFADVGLGVSVAGHGDLGTGVAVVAAQNVNAPFGGVGIDVHDTGGVAAPVEASEIFPLEHDIAIADFFIHQRRVGVVELFVPSQSADAEKVGFLIP